MTDTITDTDIDTICMFFHCSYRKMVGAAAGKKKKKTWTWL